MRQITSLLSSRTRARVPAFSLIELIIVILVASLFAAMVFTSVPFRKPEEKPAALLRLKDLARRNLPDNTQLVCVDACRTCVLMRGSRRTPIKSRIPPLKAYTLDEGGNAQEIDFGRMEDKPVCLRFYFYANGSTSQMILEADDTYYFVPSFFGQTESFDSLDGAVARWQGHRDRLDTLGTFY